LNPAEKALLKQNLLSLSSAISSGSITTNLMNYSIQPLINLLVTLLKSITLLISSVSYTHLLCLFCFKCKENCYHPAICLQCQCLLSNCPELCRCFSFLLPLL
jgi:hypothetical protein